MELHVNATSYNLGVACNCPKQSERSCGINYRVG